MNKYSNNAAQRDSHNFIADESINQRDFEDTVIGENSGNLQKFGLGGKFGQLPGTTEAVKAKKRYSYQSEH